MSDNKEGEEIVPKGNEWEVVALTESTYAASPGPKQNILDQSLDNPVGDNNAETADAMFVSGHFGYSPSTLENLLLEESSKEKPDGMGGGRDVSEAIMHKGGKSDLKHVDDIHIEGLISEEFSGASKFDDKGSSGSFYNSDFGDVASSGLIEKEHSLYSTGKFTSYDDKATAGRSFITDDDLGIVDVESFESLDPEMDPSLTSMLKHDDDDEKFNELPDFPHEAWWKRHATYLYDHVKNVNPYWSIVVAAAVVGLVIIGHRWQRGKPQVFKVKSQLVIDEKGSRWIPTPISRLKNVGLGGQNSAYMRASSPTEL